ncbi:MAG: hypothetical protein U0559_14870 [Anaerolineae bacterium]
MELRRKLKIMTVLLLLSIALVSTFLSPQAPVAQGGQWCGQSCSQAIVTPPPPTE